MFRHCYGALIFIFVFNISYSQEISNRDTLDYDEVTFDTIYLQPDTLYVVDTVVNEVTSEFKYSHIVEPYYSRTISFIDYNSGERNTFTVPYFAYSSEFGIVYQLQLNAFIMRAGLGINTVKCRYKFYANMLSQQRTQSYFDTVEVSYVDLPGTPYIDSIPNYVINAEYITYYDTLVIASPHQNIYTYLTIPLSFSYPLLVRQKSVLYLDAGIAARVYLDAGENNIIEKNNTLLLISNGDMKLFNLDIRCGLSYTFLINDSTDFSVSSYFSMTTSSLHNKDSYLIKLRDIGVRLGWVKYF